MGKERAELGFYFDRQNYESYLAQRSVPARQKALHRVFEPGDALSIFTTTNYSKGSIFLETLEQELGRSRFDSVMQSWFRRYAFRWADERADVYQRMKPHYDANTRLNIERILGITLVMIRVEQLVAA